MKSAELEDTSLIRVADAVIDVVKPKAKLSSSLSGCGNGKLYITSPPLELAPK